MRISVFDPLGENQVAIGILKEGTFTANEITWSDDDGGTLSIVVEGTTLVEVTQATEFLRWAEAARSSD